MTWAIVLFAVAAVCALIAGVCSLCVVACPASLIGGILLCVF